MNWPKLINRLLRCNEPVRRRPHGLPGPLVVSLTSHAPRFETAAWTVRSLLSQSIQPDRVVLWLDEGDEDHLPDVFDSGTYQNLSIAVSHRDLRSYTKLIPSLERWPEAYIATADDDVYYSPHWLEDLVAQTTDQCHTYAHRCHRIKGDPAPYRQWKTPSHDVGAHRRNFATGVGGVLYPPGVLHEDVMDVETFKRLCPTADDVWLWWQTRRAGHVAERIPSTFALAKWPGGQAEALGKQNIGGGGNDEQIQNLIEYYGWPEC